MKMTYETKKCLKCGKDFKVNAWQQTKKYCSEKCKAQYYKLLIICALFLLIPSICNSKIILTGNYNDQQKEIAAKYNDFYKNDYVIECVDKLETCGSVFLLKGYKFYGCNYNGKTIQVLNSISNYQFELTINHEIYHTNAPTHSESLADAYAISLYRKINNIKKPVAIRYYFKK